MNMKQDASNVRGYVYTCIPQKCSASVLGEGTEFGFGGAHMIAIKTHTQEYYIFHPLSHLGTRVNQIYSPPRVREAPSCKMATPSTGSPFPRFLLEIIKRS